MDSLDEALEDLPLGDLSEPVPFHGLGWYAVDDVLQWPPSKLLLPFKISLPSICVSYADALEEIFSNLPGHDV